MGLANCADEYCKQLDEKLALLEQFKEETVNVKRFLDDGEVDGIGLHLKKRQRVVDRISRLDKDMNRLKERAHVSAESDSAKTGRRIKSYYESIKDALEKIAAVDQECRSKAIEFHDGLKRNILQMKQGVAATKGYGAPRCKDPKFLDVRR